MVIVLMGVTGSGKTVVGELLARELGWKFYDGDDFHPRANVEKMAAGVPLTDEDRFPWLRLLAEKIGRWVDRGEQAILACSALKAVYREILVCRPEVRVVHLQGSIELIRQRLEERVHRYMPPSLLASQFATLEDPHDALTIDITPAPETIVREIRKKVGNLSQGNFLTD
jgi:gluconokinase